MRPFDWNHAIKNSGENDILVSMHRIPHAWQIKPMPIDIRTFCILYRAQELNSSRIEGLTAVADARFMAGCTVLAQAWVMSVCSTSQVATSGTVTGDITNA